MCDSARSAITQASGSAAAATAAQPTLSGLPTPPWGAFNPAQQTGGLTEVFGLVGVPAAVTAYVKESTDKPDGETHGGLGCETLLDFHTLTNKEDSNEGLKQPLSRREAVADKPVPHARLNQAWVQAGVILSHRIVGRMSTHARPAIHATRYPRRTTG